MKKSILMLAVAGMVMASCAKEETVKITDSRAISFDNFVGKATKAATNTDSIKQHGFGVYGGSDNAENENLFDNVTVKWDGSKWGYDDTKYWMPGKTYKFAAYAPQVAGAIRPTWSYENGKLTFDITCDATHQNDLVYGVAAEVAVPDKDNGFAGWTTEPVSFSMKHLLSKLNFVVKAGDIESDAKLKIENVTIVANQLDTAGTYNGTTAWTSSNPADVTFNGAANTIGIAKAATHSLGVYYVIPQTSKGDVTVKFTVTLFAGETQIGEPTELTATIKNPTTWAQDFVYTYTATVNQENIEGGKPIEFTGTVDDWTNKDNNTDLGDLTITPGN